MNIGGSKHRDLKGREVAEEKEKEKWRRTETKMIQQSTMENVNTGIYEEVGNGAGRGRRKR